jgi:hypothetical protein
MRGSVLAMLVSQPLYPLLDGLKFRSHPARFPCCSDGVARAGNAGLQGNSSLLRR